MNDITGLAEAKFLIKPGEQLKFELDSDIGLPVSGSSDSKSKREKINNVITYDPAKDFTETDAFVFTYQKGAKKLQTKEDEAKNHRKIRFLLNFCISLDKPNTEIKKQLIKLLFENFSNELLTQFEARLSLAWDKVFSPFMDFVIDTREYVYKMLKEDMDSREAYQLRS